MALLQVCKYKMICKFPRINLKHHGFSLLEILISMLLISISMLGIASLITRSMQMGQDGLLRTQAIILTGNMIESIEANNAGAFNQDYVIAAAAAVDNPPDCLQIYCTPTQLATYDLGLWKQTIADQLPGGTGAISATVNGDIINYTLVISWNERRSKTEYEFNENSAEVVSYITNKSVYDFSAI